MKFAVNYSREAEALCHAGHIHVDRFKCPAWPDLLTDVQTRHPLYVHFPLRVGMGIGDAMDMETEAPADWARVEALLARTHTPWVNVHVGPSPYEYPHIPVESTAPDHVEPLTEAIIRDVSALVARFGGDHVVAENVYDYDGNEHLHASFLPSVLQHVVEETGCGFLLDLSHAYLAAYYLGRDPYAYTQALPTAHIREIHVSGNQRITETWLTRMHEAGVQEETIQKFKGHLLDHLPMTAADWQFVDWAMAQVHDGAWRTPEIVAFEYGGIGPMFQAVTSAEVLAEQIPRLYALVKG